MPTPRVVLAIVLCLSTAPVRLVAQTTACPPGPFPVNRCWGPTCIICEDPQLIYQRGIRRENA